MNVSGVLAATGVRERGMASASADRLLRRKSFHDGRAEPNQRRAGPGGQDGEPVYRLAASGGLLRFCFMF